MTHIAIELRLPVEQAEALERFLSGMAPLVETRCLGGLSADDYEHLPQAIAAMTQRLRERAEPFE